MPRFLRKRVRKKSPFAPIIEDILSQEVPEVRARRVLGRTVVSTKVSTAGGETLARSVSVHGKKWEVTAASRVSKDKRLGTGRRTRRISIKRKKK